ncbi:hypothetical protein F4808DRAFT_421053 [Astrocystis sublimbata]|nr:hypothetical protein F4808DRAFT_421053 [Astrocystis sublimbata]
MASPSASETVSPDSSVFPFNRLPTELRLMIVEPFALPKHPLRFHLRYLHRGRGVEMHPETAFNMYYRPELWSLSRVNREIRHIVLRGRQPVFDGRRPVTGSQKRYTRLKPTSTAILFVDWNHDVVCIGPAGDPGYPDPSIQQWLSPTWAANHLDDLTFQQWLIPTWAANLQHLLYEQPCFDIERWFPSRQIKERLFTAADVCPSLRCFSISILNLTVPGTWNGHETSTLMLWMNPSRWDGNREPLPCLEDKAITKRAWEDLKVQRGDSLAVPLTSENMILAYPGCQHREGFAVFAGWCEDFVRRLHEMEDEWQEEVSRRCGRTIKVAFVLFAWHDWAPFHHKPEPRARRYNLRSRNV